MPAKRAMTEREFFKNANTWKQISTNVPPKMLAALKSCVTKEFTMSHLLRELIAESSLMRYGQLPRPSWCAELIDQVASLREEISTEKQVRVDVEKVLFELRNEIAELRKGTIPVVEPAVTVRQMRYEERAQIVALLQDEKKAEPSSKRETQTLQFAPDYDPYTDEYVVRETFEPVQIEDEREEESQNPVLTKTRQSMTLFGRITEMLGVGRKTA